MDTGTASHSEHTGSGSLTPGTKTYGVELNPRSQSYHFKDYPGAFKMLIIFVVLLTNEVFIILSSNCHEDVTIKLNSSAISALPNIDGYGMFIGSIVDQRENLVQKLKHLAHCANV